MQIKTGTVNVTNGQTLVVGSGVNWSEVTVGSLFICQSLCFEIQSVDAENNHLTLNVPFTGATTTGASYVVVRDFSLNFSLPLLNPGDLEAATIFTRAVYMLDQLLAVLMGGVQTGTVQGIDFACSKTGHGFVVGNVLSFYTKQGDPSAAWNYALSDSAAHATPAGVVSKVIDANSFLLRTMGTVGATPNPAIQGITLTPGATYYLRGAVSGSTNLTANLSDIGAAGEVPVLIADTTTSGFILSMSTAKVGRFAQDKDGVVPGPTAADIAAGKVLGPSGWVSPSPGSNSVRSQHLYRSGSPTYPLGSTPWSQLGSNAADLSIPFFLLDLNQRASALENVTAQSSALTRILYSRKTGGTPGPSSKSTVFTVPSGKTYASWTFYFGRAIEGIAFRTRFTTPLTPSNQWTIYIADTNINEPNYGVYGGGFIFLMRGTTRVAALSSRLSSTLAAAVMGSKKLEYAWNRTADINTQPLRYFWPSPQTPPNWPDSVVPYGAVSFTDTNPDYINTAETSGLQVLENFKAIPFAEMVYACFQPSDWASLVNIGLYPSLSVPSCFLVLEYA